MSLTIVPLPLTAVRGRLAIHFDFFRLDHSVKQIFVFPGIAVAASVSAWV